MTPGASLLKQPLAGCPITRGLATGGAAGLQHQAQLVDGILLVCCRRRFDLPPTLLDPPRQRDVLERNNLAQLLETQVGLGDPPLVHGVQQRRRPCRPAAQGDAGALSQLDAQPRIHGDDPVGNPRIREMLQGQQGSAPQRCGWRFFEKLQHHWNTPWRVNLAKNFNESGAIQWRGFLVAYYFERERHRRWTAEPQAQPDKIRPRIASLPCLGKPRFERRRDFLEPTPAQRQVQSLQQRLNAGIVRGQRQESCASREPGVGLLRRVASRNPLGQVLTNQGAAPDRRL